MKSILVAGLLAAAGAAAWLGAIGFARLRVALDRLHCATFVNVVSGTALAAASVVYDGVSDRALKILFIVFINCLAGAVASHVTGRALLQRRKAP